MPKKPSLEIQAKAATHVAQAFRAYEDRMMPRKSELLELYEEYSTFREPKEENWATSFKVNKMQEVMENILPSLTAKNPRWIVSLRDVKAFKDTSEVARLKGAIKEEQGEENIVDEDDVVLKQKEESVKEHAEAVQDYLTYLYEEYNLLDKIELWGKNGIADGKGYVDVSYKIEKAFVSKKVPIEDELGEQMMDEEGELQYREVTEPVVTGEYPTVDIVDWPDIYYDSRYITLEERPAVIRFKPGVRFADLWRYKSRYMNLDKVKEMVRSLQDFKEDQEGFRRRVYQIAGIQDYDRQTSVDINSLTLKCFQGYFSPTGEPEDEKLFKIVTVEDAVVVQMEEITFISIEEWKCFPNGKNGNAVGFVEPIRGMQEEFNFKKNSASEYINKSLQRQRIWSPNSGISPKSLDLPVVSTTADGQTALANIPEIPFRPIPPGYFSEGNDFERQIQAATHTIDTANPRTQNALTDTATGAKIKFYESNKVLEAVRRRFERALERLAYKLLQCAFENMNDNIIFKKTKSEGYWHMNKEILRDAINKYQIKIEVNSSSYSDIEDRRAEAIGWFNILQGIDKMLEASGSDRRVDYIPVLEEVGHTFEKKDPMKFLKSVQAMPSPQMPALPGTPGGRMKPPERVPTDAEALTETVAGKI
jgi:hypothetical protein